MEETILVESVYWMERCKLAEKIIKECPCDPDITVEQMAAHSNYDKFLDNFKVESK